MTMNNPDDFPICSRSALSGPDSELLQLFPEDAVPALFYTDYTTQYLDDILQDDLAGCDPNSIASVHSDPSQDTSTLFDFEEQTQDAFVAVANAGPTIHPQQLLHPLNTNGGYAYAQEKGNNVTVSPTAVIVTSPDGQNAGFDDFDTRFTGFSMTPPLESGKSAPYVQVSEPVHTYGIQTMFPGGDSLQPFEQNSSWPMQPRSTDILNFSSSLNPEPISPLSRRSSFDMCEDLLDPSTQYQSSIGSRRSSADSGDIRRDPNFYYTGSKRSPGDCGDDASSIRSKRPRDDDDAFSTRSIRTQNDASSIRSTGTRNVAFSIRSVRTQNDASSIRSVRTQNDASSVRSKRTPMIKGGFPCKFRGCTVIKDRECDERKHYKTAHSAEQERPYGCKLCPKRFHYPKDIKRHMAQTHKIFEDETPENESPPKIKTPSKRRFSLASLASMVQKLQLWHKEPAPSSPTEQILVTADRINFRKISLKDVETSEALMQKIGSTFGVSVEDALLRCCGSGRLGKCVDRTQLMATVRKAVKAGTTLELLFTPKSERTEGRRDCY